MMDMKEEQCATISFWTCLQYTLVHRAKLLKEADKVETLYEVTITKLRKWYTQGHKTVRLALHGG